MLAALSTNGIPVLVLRSALRQRARALGAPDYGRSPLALSPHDLHPSALGHEAIAEELAAWIPPNLPRS
jgi:lysophospholipase L1-like esterase